MSSYISESGLQRDIEHSFLSSNTTFSSSATNRMMIRQIENEDRRPLGLLTEEQFRRLRQHEIDPRLRQHDIDHRIDLMPFHLTLPLNHGNFDTDDEDDDISVAEVKQSLFEQKPLVESDCDVCMNSVKMYSRVCCSQLICDACLLEYITEKIQEGYVHFTCPAFGCSQPVTRDEIISTVTSEALLDKYHRFVINANAESNKKTCPNCCAITTLDMKTAEKFGHVVICEQCSFPWCFDCHSPSHEGLKCKDNMKGVKALTAWIKTKYNGQRNARKCPKCKLLIQRSGGCDHMKCIRCRTHFCYACGGRQLRARFLFGNHYERLSVLGCPRNFMDGKKKHLRRFVRGSIFSGKLLVGVVGSAVLVGLLPVAAAAAVFAGPAIGFVRLHRYLQLKKNRKLVKRARSLRDRTASGIKGEHRVYSLVPRRDVDDSELDLEEMMRMMTPLGFYDDKSLDISDTRATTASSERSSLSDSPLSTRSAPSLATQNDQMLTADIDEITTL